MSIRTHWKGIVMVVAGVVVAVLLGTWTAVGYSSTKDIETPAYEVVREASNYEVRDYAPCIRAEVTLEGEYRETMYGGFRQVADYIFGNNAKQNKIAMTAPVVQEPAAAPSEKIAMTAPVVQEPASEDGRYTIAFIMPSEYTMETLPTPKNDAVTLREVPGERVAVISFRGYATKGAVKRKTDKLLKALDKDGLQPSGAVRVAQYDPPWTPPFMRTNEIQVPIAATAGAH